MDDTLLVRVLDRGADLYEQIKPLVDAQLVAVTVLGDRHAGHVLHHEVRQSLIRRAGVVDARDVGVIHQCQGLPFGLESCGTWSLYYRSGVEIAVPAR